MATSGFGLGLTLEAILGEIQGLGLKKGGGIQKIEARDRSSPEKEKEMNDRREPRGGFSGGKGESFRG